MKARVYPHNNNYWTFLLSACLLLVFVFYGAPALYSQAPTVGSVVKVNGFNSTQPAQFFAYDGSNRLQYICQANPQSAPHTYSVALTNLTNIVVTGNTTATINFPAAHGVWAVGMPVTISGSATTTLNGTFYTQSITSTTVLVLTVPSTANATYTDMTIKAGPVTIDAIWAIGLQQYDASSNLASVTWAKGNAANYSNICANRAVTTGATAVFYY